MRIRMNKNSKIIGLGLTGEVTIDGKYLDLGKSLKLRNHSPDGFSWGYGGSGPSQLALALLLEATDQETALKYYQDFKWDVISKLPMSEDFEMPAQEYIYNWLYWYDKPWSSTKFAPIPEGK